MITSTEDHRTASYQPPSGCQLCGIGENVHAQRWRSGTGWHGYVPPTDDQILTRMRERRENRRTTIVHPHDCPICDAARAAYNEIARRLDPLDNGPDVEVGGITEQARITALVTHALHEHFPVDWRPAVKPRITRPAPGRWQVERPAVGFTRATTTVSVYTSWCEAMRSVDRSAGIVPVHTEQSEQPHDGLSAVPSRDPAPLRWYRHEQPGDRT